MGLLDWLRGRRGGGLGAPAPTRDDTLSSTYVPPPTPEVKPHAPGHEKLDDVGSRDTEGSGDDAEGGGDGGDGDGGGNGGGGGD